MTYPLKTSLQGEDALVAALEAAGRAILALFPRELTDRLNRLIASRSEAEFEETQADLIDAALKLAEDRNPVLPGYVFDRTAPCPLCGLSCTLPGGLRDHLTGAKGANRCELMEAALRHAWDRAYDAMAATEEREAAALAAQRAAGPLYLFSLGQEPCLFDDPADFWRLRHDDPWLEPRSEEELPAVEAELAALGFAKIVDGIVVRYELSRHDAYVLADPRRPGRLDFVVYPPEAAAYEPPAPDEPRCSPCGYPPEAMSIHLLDIWTEDRARRLDERVRDAIAWLRIRARTMPRE